MPCSAQQAKILNSVSAGYEHRSFGVFWLPIAEAGLQFVFSVQQNVAQYTKNQDIPPDEGSAKGGRIVFWKGWSWGQLLLSETKVMET